MQWILQDFDDARALASALDRLGHPHSWHKVVPFTGDLIPAPAIIDPDAVLMFGSYALRHAARRLGVRPGVIELRPFLDEAAWDGHLLNGSEAVVARLANLPAALDADSANGGRRRAEWFVRPVEDGKQIAGRVMSDEAIGALVGRVTALDPDEVPPSALRHDTVMMLCEPRTILREWRLWVVKDRIVTHSLYREGSRVTYRNEIDDDALAFARAMVGANPGYAPAYVMDVCRTPEGMALLETNCINAAGLYAADPLALAAAMGGLGGGGARFASDGAARSEPRDRGDPRSTG